MNYKAYLIFYTSLLVPAVLLAKVTPIDKIIAIVNSDVVLQSDLDSRITMIQQQYAQSKQPLPPKNTLAQQVLDRLIIDSIQLQMGSKAGVRIDDEVLTDTIRGIARNNKKSLQEFQEELINQGIDYQFFRNQIKQDLIIQEVQRYHLSRRIRVTPKELKNFLESPIGKKMVSDDYLVGHMLISVSRRASENTIKNASERAEKLYLELQEGADFRKLAIANSDDNHAFKGSDLGWRKAAELPELFADAAIRLSIGGVLEPIRSPSGFHIVSLLDKKGASEGVEQQYKTRHILVQTSTILDAEAAENLMQNIHEKLMAGEDFAELAQLYSDDPGSALTGGDIGWVTGKQLALEFAAQMESIPINKISAPFQTEFGWHILQVQEERQQDTSQEQRERRALNYLRSQRFEEKLEDFLAEIRSEAYVELK